MSTVRELLSQHEAGQLPFEHLVSALAAAPYSQRSAGRDLGEAYTHAEGPPDDNDFSWVDSAHDRDVITDEQRQHIIDAIDAHHSSAR